MFTPLSQLKAENPKLKFAALNQAVSKLWTVRRMPQRNWMQRERLVAGGKAGHQVAVEKGSLAAVCVIHFVMSLCARLRIAVTP